MLSGLYIKNLLTANDETILNQKLAAWNACDPVAKEQIKAGVCYFLCLFSCLTDNLITVYPTIIASRGSQIIFKECWTHGCTSIGSIRSCGSTG